VAALDERTRRRSELCHLASFDEGAIFQHAALVAREYRIPCIIQAGEATTAINDGQSITIDGEAGIVELDPVL
jgi:phosphoenolpyruvate-protein kinase (PTS system EI component)